MQTAKRSYCKAVLGASADLPGNPVRQMLAFPPVDTTQQAVGLVRQRCLLLELGSGAVYHLGVPFEWDLLPDRISKLARAIHRHDSLCPHRSHIASVVGWNMEIKIELLDLDLFAPSTADWPLRAVALQRYYANLPMSGASVRFSERIAEDEEAIGRVAGDELGRFVSRLDPEILGLSGQWEGMPWARYNWFANSPKEIRTYRIQMARVFPALVPILSGEVGKPGPFAQSLSEVVNRGRPLVQALVSLCGVRTTTARHALTMPPVLLEWEKLPTLIRALDWLIPERFPRTPAEWSAFEQLVHSELPKLTNCPATNPINFALLPDISRKGWVDGANHLSGPFADDGTVALVREFLDSCRKALVWDIARSEPASKDLIRSSSLKAVSDTLASAGLLRTLEAAKSFPVLLREAENQLSERREILLGERWKCVIEETMMFEECLIEPILTAAALTAIGSELGNCLGSGYALECSNGSSHIFLVCNSAGIKLGALQLRFPIDRHGGYAIQIVECKGPQNAKISTFGWKAVAAFCGWLRTESGQRRILEFQRQLHTPRHKSAGEIKQQIEMEAVIAALKQLRQKPLRFEALRKRAMDLLAKSVVESDDSARQLGHFEG